MGRREELWRVARVLRGEPGAAIAILITGDAGIGKTRLLAEACRAVPDVTVLAGACLPLSKPLPYGAIGDAVSGLVRPAMRGRLDGALDPCAPYVRPQLAALMSALADPPPEFPDTAGDRMRLFAAVRDLLAALGAERRTALVVEDLHWADAGTLDLLTFLVRGLPPGIALVGTSRYDEFDESLDVITGLWSGRAAPAVPLSNCASFDPC